jgi:hypothetical protein
MREMCLEVEERDLVTSWVSHLYVHPYYIFLDPPLFQVFHISVTSVSFGRNICLQWLLSVFQVFLQVF